MSKKQKISLLLFIIFGSIVLSLPMIRSGLVYPYGIGFWGPNAHDATWHLSLINHLGNPLKITMPIYSGEYLKNYHPFYNILISFLTKLTPISSSIWLFQLFPLLSSAAILFLSFKIGQKLTRKFSGGILLIIINTLASSAGFLVTLYRFGSLGGESLFWSMQSASMQSNPPFILSLLFILLILYFIVYQYYQKPKIWLSLLTILLLCLTPISKVYGGVALYLLLGFYSLSELKNKNLYPLLIIILSLPLAYFLFSFYNSGSESMLLFKPFWFSNTMIESPDRFYLPQIASMRYTLESSSVIGPRLIAVYSFAYFIFIFGNYFWRLLGVFSLKSSNSVIWIIFLSVIILTLIPTFFIQSGTSWNTIQFLYYALIFSNILLVIFLSQLKSSKLRYFLLLLIISTSILGNIDTYKNFLGSPSPAAINPREIEALSFISKEPKGIILTPVYNQFLSSSMNTPIPLYAYQTSAYLSAYTPHTTYLADEMNLSNSGYDWKSRKEQIISFFEQKNIYQDRGLLVNNKIDYIYLVDQQLPLDHLDQQGLSLKKIFDNGYVRIYQVQR